MANHNNPTKTRSIERRWIKEVRAKYVKFGVDAANKLREITQGYAVLNVEIGLNQSQQRVFMAWLMGEIEALTGELPPNNWQNQYQLESYYRALERTRASLISQGAQITMTDAEIVQASGITSFTATPSIGSMTTLAPIHQDALEFLFTRSYESLKGWNDTLAKEVRQITFDAVKSGIGIREVTAQIKERVNVTSSRAELIARTEIGQAYKESALNEIDRASEELGEQLEARWISALSPTTRHRHASWHGDIVSTDEARKRKSGYYMKSDIYNCKCSVVPVVRGFGDTPAKNKVFAEQKARYMEIESKAGKA